jgi:hypothetical protein
MGRSLEVSVWNREKVSHNQLFGRTSIKLSEVLPPATAKEGWFELYDGDTGRGQYKIMTLNGSPSDHYVALYDYNPRCKQELLMRQDDIVILVEVCARIVPHPLLCQSLLRCGMSMNAENTTLYKPMR